MVTDQLYEKHEGRTPSHSQDLDLVDCETLEYDVMYDVMCYKTKYSSLFLKITSHKAHGAKAQP